MKIAETNALIDCGAEGRFVNEDKVNLKKAKKLKRPLKVKNVDGSPNRKGWITHHTLVNYSIHGVKMKDWFFITDIGDQDMILGMPWLKTCNPRIDWRQMSFTFDDTVLGELQLLEEKKEAINEQREINKERELLINFIGKSDLWIRAKMSATQSIEHKFRKEEKKVELPKEYQEWKEVFSKEASQRFPSSRPWDHEIKLKEGFIPKINKVYPLSQKEQGSLDEWIKEQLEKGYIVQSKSPQASSFFFVGKKDTEALRPCQDYRYLNEWTVKNGYPLPLVPDLMTKLQGAKYFTKLDLRWGYNNVRIKKGDEWKAAFVTNRGMFEPKVMFFGLCNSPATFQTMMDSYFVEMINEGWIVIYMDDILIFAKTKEELRAFTKRVLRRLKEKDLFLKLEKCKFEQEKIDFLGMVISHNSIQMDPVKLAGISEWPAPTTVKQVRSFLGFCNFYRRFIGNFAEISKPLVNLTRKTQPWEWTESQALAFQELKSKFATGPILQMPDPAKPFLLETDASKFAVGALLKQPDSTGLLRPCGYLSHALTPTEQNYQVYDRELLAIVTALKAWRHILHGSPHPVIVRTDHKNLLYYRGPQRLTPRQARWRAFLTEFELKLEHIPGKDMQQADALSRRPDHIIGSDEDHLIETMIPDKMVIRAISEDLRERIKTGTEADSLGRKIIDALDKKDHLPIRGDRQDWAFIDGILRRKGICYVPDDIELRKQLIKDYHEAPTSGHPGRFKTFSLLVRDYYWPGMGAMIGKFVEGCATCQQMKPNTHPTTPGLVPIGSISTRPFEQITMDFITDLPESDGFDSIFVVVDHGLTKGVIFTPCNKTIDALGTADLYLNHVYKRFGLPSVMISDRGPQFAAKTFQELTKALEIDHRMSTAYHPQTDGQTERVNQELENHLRILCRNDPTGWAKALPIAEFAHNQRTHEARNMSPFKLMHGTEPVSIPMAIPRVTVPTVEERLKELKQLREEALAAHELSKQRMAQRITSKGKPYKVGDKVWLSTQNLTIPGRPRKLAPRRTGPLIVLKVVGPVTYKLKLPRQWKIHDTFHASYLSPYRETDFHGPNYPEPPPDILNGEEHYEVEAILDHKGVGRRRLYFLKWKGYSDKENSWEPESGLDNAKSLLRRYKKRYKL